MIILLLAIKHIKLREELAPIHPRPRVYHYCWTEAALTLLSLFPVTAHFLFFCSFAYCLSFLELDLDTIGSLVSRPQDTELTQLLVLKT